MLSVSRQPPITYNFGGGGGVGHGVFGGAFERPRNFGRPGAGELGGGGGGADIFLVDCVLVSGIEVDLSVSLVGRVGEGCA